MLLFGFGIHAHAQRRLHVGRGHTLLVHLNQVGVLGGAVEPRQPGQGLLDFIGVKACCAEFAAQQRQFGTNVTTPVVFVNVYKDIEHVCNITFFKTGSAGMRQILFKSLFLCIALKLCSTQLLVQAAGHLRDSACVYQRLHGNQCFV